MGNYVKSRIFVRPEPTVPKPVVEKPSPQIDLSQIANVVANVVSSSLEKINFGTSKTTIDGFDNSNTLEKIAKQMIMQGSSNKINLEKIGDVVETVTDNKEIQSTIDLLSNLED